MAREATNEVADHMLINPQVLTIPPRTGTASDLLYRAGSSGSFELADSNRLDSGIVILTYRTSTG